MASATFCLPLRIWENNKFGRVVTCRNSICFTDNKSKVRFPSSCSEATIHTSCLKSLCCCHTPRNLSTLTNPCLQYFWYYSIIVSDHNQQQPEFIHKLTENQLMLCTVIAWGKNHTCFHGPSGSRIGDAGMNLPGATVSVSVSVPITAEGCTAWNVTFCIKVVIQPLNPERIVKSSKIHNIHTGKLQANISYDCWLWWAIDNYVIQDVKAPLWSILVQQGCRSATQPSKEHQNLKETRHTHRKNSSKHHMIAAHYGEHLAIMYLRCEGRLLYGAFCIKKVVIQPLNPARIIKSSKRHNIYTGKLWPSIICLLLIMVRSNCQ